MVNRRADINVLYLAVLGVVEVGPPERDQSDGESEGDVSEERDVDRPVTERLKADREHGRDGSERDERARRVPERAGEDCQRVPGTFVGSPRLVGWSERGDDCGRARADDEDEPGAPVDQHRAGRDRADRGRRLRTQSRCEDAHHGHDDNEQGREDEQDDEHLGQQFEEVARLLAGAGLPIAQHPTLHLEVARQRVRPLLGVLAELYQEGRERVPRGRVPGHESEALAEAPGQRGLVERLPEGDGRLTVGLLAVGDLPEHGRAVVAPRRERVEIPDRAGQGGLDVRPAGARGPLEVAPGERDGGALAGEADGESCGGRDSRPGHGRDGEGFEAGDAPADEFDGRCERGVGERDHHDERPPGDQREGQPRQAVGSREVHVEARGHVGRPVALPVGVVARPVGVSGEQGVECAVEDREGLGSVFVRGRVHYVVLLESRSWEYFLPFWYLNYCNKNAVVSQHRKASVCELLTGELVLGCLEKLISSLEAIVYLPNHTRTFLGLASRLHFLPLRPLDGRGLVRL